MPLALGCQRAWTRQTKSTVSTMSKSREAAGAKALRGWGRSFRRERKGQVTCVTSVVLFQKARSGGPKLKGRACPQLSLAGEKCREFRINVQCNDHAVQREQRGKGRIT